VHYLDADHLAFGLDHWGVGMSECAPLAVDYSKIHTLSVTWGTASARTGLKIKFDDKDVWQSAQTLYPCTEESVVLGRNSIGASTCSTNFNGIIMSGYRADAVGSLGGSSR
jgi:hypothetical protein